MTTLLLDLAILVFRLRLLALFEDLLAEGFWSRFPFNKGSYFETDLFLDDLIGVSLLKDMFFWSISLFNFEIISLLFNREFTSSF